MINILIAFMAIVVLIIIHEWGHMQAARLCGLPVYEFSIFMGPLLFKLKSKKHPETQYSIRAIPLGGYCSFDKITTEKDNKKDKDDMSILEDIALEQIPVWKRVIILLAGPFSNIILAFMIVLLTLSLAKMPVGTNIVESLSENSPSQDLIKPGDKIVSIDDLEYDGTNSMFDYIQTTENESVKVKLIRDNEKIEVLIKPEINEDGVKVIGIIRTVEYEKVSFKEALSYSVEFLKDGIIAPVLLINGLRSGKYTSQDFSGIVGITNDLSKQISQDNIYMFIIMVAYISINLGVFNLFPIPGLDGFKTVQYIIEGIIHKKMDRKIIYKFTVISFAVLIFFMIVTAGSDISKLL